MNVQAISYLLQAAYTRVVLAAAPTTTPAPAPGYQLPPARCDIANAAKPVGDLFIGELLGFAPYAGIVIAVGCVLALLVVAAIENLRGKLLRVLGAVVGIGVLGTVLISAIVAFVHPNC